MTVATAYALLTGRPYDSAYQQFGRRYPNAGYGSGFQKWLLNEQPAPYNSFGNGSAMRVSPVGFACSSVDEVLLEAERSAAVTHNHEDTREHGTAGIKGAQATALAVFLARSGASKEDIRSEVMARFGYDLDRCIDDIRPEYSWDVTCQGSVPEAILAFLESTDAESAIRLAISLGGDADTQATIAGGIAQAFYGDLPSPIVSEVRQRLPAEFIVVIDQFEARFMAPGWQTGRDPRDV